MKLRYGDDINIDGIIPCNSLFAMNGGRNRYATRKSARWFRAGGSERGEKRNVM